MASVPAVLSRILPIMGNAAATDSVPNPPMMDRPNAPLCGKFSDINASVVGQKKVTPTANIAAATNTNGPEAVASNCMPRNENIAENHNIPTVLVFA